MSQPHFSVVSVFEIVLSFFRRHVCFLFKLVVLNILEVIKQRMRLLRCGNEIGDM